MSPRTDSMRSIWLAARAITFRMASEDGGSVRCGRGAEIVGPKSHETHMIHRRWLLALFLPCLAITSPAVADFAGKVVGVSDGDTITVLRDRTQVRIRLYGVDCPETGQDFGSRAKQFTSELEFCKVSIGPVGQSHDQTAAPSLLPVGSPRPMLRAGFPGALPDRLRRWSSVDGAPTHAHSSAATGSSRDYTPA